MHRSLRSVALVIFSALVCAAPVAAHAGGPARAERGRRVSTERNARRARTRRGRFRRIGDRLMGRQQHELMPLRPGSRRTFSVVNDDGKGGVTHSSFTERVTAVRREKGLLRGQVETTWGAGSTTQHVVEVGRGGVRLTTAERLDSRALPGTTSDGVGLPRDLWVDRVWTSHQNSVVEGHHITWTARNRVLDNVRQRGPDGKMHDGFLIESVNLTTTVAPDGKKSWSGYTSISTYLKGIGVVHSETRTQHQPGAVMTRTLTGFDRGGD